MRSKGSRIRIGCLIFLGAIVLTAGAILLLRQSVGRLGVGIAVRVLENSIGGRIEYERIEGDLFSAPTIVGLRVYLNGDSLRVARVTVSYSLMELVAGRIPVSRLELFQPELFIKELPDFAGSEDETETAAIPELPRLNIDRLALHNARVHLGDTLRIDSLTLIAAGQTDQADAYVRIERLQGLAVQEEIAFRMVKAECRLVGTTVTLSDFEIRTDYSLLAGNARVIVDEGRAGIELSDLVLELGELARPLSLEELKLTGLFRARGTAELSDADKAASVVYSTERLRIGGIVLPNLSGSVVLENTLVSLVASGASQELGQFTVNGSFDYNELSYRARLSMRRIRPSGLTALFPEQTDMSLPDIILDADINLSGTAFDPVKLDASGRVPGLGVDTFRLTGSRDGRRITVSRFDARGRSGRVQASGSYYTDGRVDGELLLDELDIEPFAGLAGIEATGRIKGMVRGAGTVDSVNVVGGVRVGGFSYGDVAIDVGMAEFDVAVGRELHGRLAVGAENIQFDEYVLDAAQLTLLDSDFSLRVDRPADRLTAQGSYRLGREQLQLDVTGFIFAAGNETLSLVEPFAVDWSADTLAVRGVRYELADGLLELDLLRVGDAPPELTVSVREVDLARLALLLRLDTAVTGTADFVVSGREALTGRLSISDLRIPDIGLELRHVGLEAGFADSEVSLERLWLVHKVDTSVVSGRARLITDGEFSVSDIDMDVRLADPGAWPLFFLRGIVDLRTGQIYGDLTVKGDLVNPDLAGRLRISRGQLWVPAINALIERTNAEIVAEDGRIDIAKVSGALGSGIATAEGFVQLGTDWEVDTLGFDIRFEDAVVRPIPEAHVVASGGIVLSLAKNRPLSIDGTIRAREALLTFGFGRETPPTASAPGAESVVFDIRIRGERGIWLRNRMADIEMSVDLSLRKTMQDETWAGVLSTRQGNIYYLDRTLRVTRGEIRFENISTVDPELDIVAELPVHLRDDDPGTYPDRIILTLSGTLSRPEFRFSSEPIAWDETEIITYLSLNVTPAEFDAFHDREVVARYLSERLLGVAQTEFTKQVRRWLAVDALRFETELTGGEGHRVTVGKYVGRNLYVTVTQNFGGEMLPELRLEYYLGRRSEIVGERNEDGRFSVRYRHTFRY